jgi:type VI secretion system protein ImpE
LQEKRLADALLALKREVREAPSNVELRVRLFALNSIMGHLDKAGADLDAIKSLDKTWAVPVQVYQSLIKAECLRREVFVGRAKPLVMGEPDGWLAWNIQSLALESTGQMEQAVQLRSQAWEDAPEYPSVVDGQRCAWLSDVDKRLGPALEAILDGKYYWIPFGQLRKIEPRPAEFLIETVWVPATLTVAGGCELSAHLPARYPGTEAAADGELVLGHKTAWTELPGGEHRPMGQKMIASETADFGLLSCKLIEFQSSQEETA